MTVVEIMAARRQRPAQEPDRDRARPLAIYTFATILVGFATLLVATLTIPVSPRIAVDFVANGGEVAGVVLWVIYGLAGAARIIRNPSGHGALTFHLPFIVAATALGGPVAGGWVGALASFDRRELEEAPWYGILSNHAVFAGSAVVGGLALQAVLMVPVERVDPGLLELVAILAGTVVFTLLSVGVGIGTIALRGNLGLLEALGQFNDAFRRTTIAEAVLGWILALVYVAVGWWAPIVCAVLVLALWQADSDHGRLETDELTGLLNRAGVRSRLDGLTDLARRGGPGATALYLDLNKFGDLNKRIGYDAANEVLIGIAERIRQHMRVTDVAGRIFGDEFMVVYPGVTDDETARVLADRLHRALALPYETTYGIIDDVSASVGAAILLPGSRMSGERLEDLSSRRMFHAKHRGGGVEMEQEHPRNPGGER